MEPMDEDTPSSGQQHSGSTSTPTTSKHPPPSPTPGATPNSSTQTASGQSQSAQLSKRRRGLGVVTPNACTECRKKRAKCDGNKPCGRCKAQKDVECVYEVPVRQSKENLRAEIDQLRRKQRSSESVLAALVRPDQWEEVLQRLRNGQSIEAISEWLGGTLPSGGGAMPNFPQRPAAVPNHLAPLTTYGPTTGAGYTTAAHRIATNSPLSAHPQGFRPENVEPNSPWSGHFSGHDPALSTRSNSHADGMSWTAENRGPPQSRVGSWVETIINPVIPEHKFRGMDQVLTPEVPEMKIPASTWTNITTDNDLVQHLLALYFCWEYPTFASLSKEHFLRDFTHGRQRYCSPILTNALLALGCRFSSHPDTRMNPEDPYTSGDHFFKESQRLFHLEDNHHNLTTIQALGIMSIREASCGRDSESWYYAGQSVRLAIEMGLHRISDEEGADEDHIAVQAATFWGAFALDHAWSLATGSLPQCSAFPHLPPKPAIIDDVEASLWIPYTDDGAPLQRACEQPSNVRSVYKCFCELSELVHQSLYILHSPGRPLTSRELLNIYTQYLNWYDKIPEVLRLGHNFTPAVLFAHMYYHFAILLLFRPLIKLRIVGSSILPKDVCAQAADAIQGLLRSYSQLYTLRRTPSFVPYFVLTSSIMHLAIAASFTEKGHAVTGGGGTPEGQHEKLRMEPRVAESIRRGIEDLTEMAPCHHFAEQALNILKYLARKWELDMELHQASPVAKEATSSLAATLASSTDPEAALRPLTDSLNFFAPNVLEGDYNCSWGRSASTAPTVFGGGGGSEAGMGGGGGGTGAGPGAGGGSEESWPPPPPPPPPGANGSPSGGVPAVPQLSRAASAMENPLFWPFPLQGRPMLPSGNRLEEAGFVLL